MSDPEATARDSLDRVVRLGEESLARLEAASRAQHEVSAEGSAGDGLVRVRLTAGGRVERVHIEPKAMRKASEDLAEIVRDACNDALERLRAAMADQEGPAAEIARITERLTGPQGSLTATLERLRTEMQHRMEQAAAELERRRPERVRRPGDPPGRPHAGPG